MYRIRLIDKAHYSAHMDFEYTVPEAERSFWMGHYPVEGKVAAFMCDDCGRLALYGMPYNADEPGGGG
jgi:hypothetical protein